MNELLARLKEEGIVFETALAGQREAMDHSITALSGEAQRFDMVTGEAERHLELLMSGAASRAGQLTQNFAREAKKLRESSDSANTTLAHLVSALHEAGAGAQALIGETASQAKSDARALVGEAMAECEKLLRTAGELAAEAGDSSTLAKSVEDVERHLLSLPGVAQQEAQRVRQMVRAETEEILDLSARTLSTIHARTAPRPTPQGKERTARTATATDCAVWRASSSAKSPSVSPAKANPRIGRCRPCWPPPKLATSARI